ncbi:MAG TPA: amino acid adenylation domain-containing protein [Longimicrobiaceae bacterium]
MSDLSQKLAELSPEKRRLLEARMKLSRGDAPRGGIRPRDPELGPAPLSHAQERLWLTERLGAGAGVYTMAYAVRLRGPLDADALRRAVDETVLRHEPLRTVFAERDGAPVQLVLPAVPADLPVEEVAGEAEARRAAREDAAAPFDLQTGPPFRARLLRLAPDEHRLLLAMHHAVSDGWSMDVLFRELAELYAAFAAGAPSPLAPLPVNYSDYAAWQREQVAGAALDAHLAWWRQALAGAPTVLDLPADRPRPPAQSFRGALHRFALPADAMAGLRALAADADATPFMALLAAFGLLLARYTGEDELVVGTPATHRTRPELHGLVGFFVNTLALRPDLRGDPTFRELLGRVRRATLDGQAHQDAPFDRVVDAVQPERDPGRTPLVQVMFALRGAHPEPRAAAGVEWTLQEEETGTAKFDLTLEVADEGPAATAAFEYATDLFDAATVERMAEHFRVLIAGIAAAPDRPVSALPLIPEDERRRVVREWNATDRPHPAGPPVHALVAEQARRHPNAPAVVAGDMALTYAELDARADRLAARLRERGVGPETRVGVLLERTPELVVAQLAVLKAGAAYLPIDPAVPDERIAYMLSDAGAPVVLASAATAGRVESFGGEVVRVDGTPLPPTPSPARGEGEHDGVSIEHTAEGQETLSQNWERVASLSEPGEGDPVDASSAPAVASAVLPSPLAGEGPGEGGPGADSLAYVIYTSGSTGTPKGVEVTHGALLNLVHWHRDAFAVTEHDRATQLAGLGFDASVWELWPYLASGAAVHLVADEETRTSPEALRDFLLGRGITAAFAPTPMAEALLALEWPAEAPLRVLLTGGDALRTRPRDGLPFALVNNYGPTENTVVATSGTVAAGRGSGRAPGIGRPVDNVRTYVLDRRGEPAPTGVPGELCVGGAQVARGYLGRPELTAAAFVPDPFAAEPGARMYRTGDRARWLADGTLEFLGRLDRQVKVRGFRIEPGEIEATLRQAPGVADAVVEVRADARGEGRLVGWVVAAEARRAEILAFARTRLPEYMVPAALVALDAFPLTPSGKTDRRALPEPEVGTDAGAAPSTPVEEVLAGIWAEVLHLETVGVRESFFALGGHSLLATQVVSRVRRALGVELPLRAVFEAPTVAGMAARVEQARREGAADMAPPLVPADRGRPLPLSFAQERLWLLDQMQPGDGVYTIPVALRLSGALDVDALRGALAEIVRRHEALRTVFERDGDGAVQVVRSAAGFELAAEDLSGVADGARPAALEARVREEARRPFDLAAGPLFRALLLRAAADEHVLVLANHHAVADGWSMDVLSRELGALYAAFARGEASPLAPLPVQYADYAAWQRGWLRGEVLERQLDAWKSRLAGAPGLLELPTNRPRPAVQSHRGAAHDFRVPGETAGALQALSRREGATQFMTLLAAWQLLLARYGGQDDVVVGTPVAGRTRAELEGMVGMFVNTLALRGDLSGDPGFRGLLARVRETVLDAHLHQDLPFERLVEALETGRSLGHAPVFQVMFSLQAAPPAAPALPGLDARVEEIPTGTAKFDLTLQITDSGGDLAASLEYATDLFDAATVERMAEHFRVLLAGIAADPDRRLSALPLLPADERRRVLEEWNATDRPHPVAPLVHELVAEQARRRPHALAVAAGGATLTFGELVARADRLAARLAALGVGLETRVGVMVERVPELVVAQLAVLGAGGAYLSIDPAVPDERIAFMLEDARVPVVLASRATADRAGRLASEVVVVDGNTEHGDAGSSSALSHSRTFALPHPPSPGSLAYVIYTSGSTGRPKGVEVPHGALLNLVHWHGRELGVTEDDRGSQLAGLGFDASVMEVWSHLCFGASLHLVADEEVRNSPAALQRLMVEERITIGFAPTPMAEALLALEWPADAALRYLLAGGDALRGRPRPEHPFVLGNAYGPTENAVVTSYESVAVGVGNARPPGIGRAVDNVRAYVLDRSLEPVPVGVPGELFAGGVQLARGYLGRPELTAAAFVPDPFSGVPGARMYRTGDRVRWLADGTLEYQGRLDRQAKVRGVRIEPGEVEAVLRQAPGVADAVVEVRADARGERRLVGWVVAPEARRDTILAFARTRLPEYMVPAALVALDAFPLTPSGKVDRRALPEAEAAAEAETAARTPTEEVLAGIWAEVLGIERVGAGESFFALGGQSLLATQVVSRIRRVFAVELPLRAVFEAPTVRDLAARVEEARRGEGAAPAPPIERVEHDGPVPLSFAQERLWFLEQMRPGEGLYTIPVALRLAGTLDADVLARALTEIVRRHEALRTAFPTLGGAPVQVVRPAFPVLLHAEPVASVGALVREEMLRPFDLEAGPLFRVRLARLDGGDHLLLVALHHSVGDGWSAGVLLRELAALYRAFAAGESSPLPEPPVQPRDHAVWQRRHLAGAALDAQLAWWRERLSGAPPVLELPTDRPRPPVPGFRAGTVRFALDAGLTAGLRALSRREGATPFMTLLAAWQLLLARYAGQDDVVVGTPIAGRTRAELEGLVGFFVNTLALRTDLSGDPDFPELLGRVREATLDAYARQDLPFERLVEALQPERDLSRNPVFQVLFVLQNAPLRAEDAGGLRIAPEEVEGTAAKFDLTLALEERDGALAGVIEYAAELFDAPTVERMAEHFRVLLEAVAAEPRRRLSALPVLTPGERALLAAGGNPEPEGFPAAGTLHGRFEAVARARPHAPAVTFRGESLTYAELDARADRLAAALRARGAGPEVRVGLCVERGPDTIVGILGILKAGAAYVPLDPTYPADRLAYLLEDSAVRVVVTQERLLGLLGASPVEVVAIDAPHPHDGPKAESAVAGCSLFPVPCSLAYVIYTSGSTGRPKGVMVTHANVLRLFESTERWFDFGPDDAWTLFHSYAFDFSVWEIWGPLLHGGRLVVVPFETSRDPEAFRALLAAERVTVLNQTPSAFRPLVATDAAAARADDLALRYVVFGGEALDPGSLRPWTDRHGFERPRLVNMHGITETTVHDSFRPVTAADVDAGSVSPIGRPLPDGRLYVLDALSEPVPFGVPGEMCVAGAAVTRGYLGRPELTAERFVPDPFAWEPGARMYRSGDRVRRLAGGELEFLGRVDHQVKIRGFRIEPGEVEAAVGAHPAVRQALVLVREDRPGDRQLVAYATADAGATDARELREWTAARVPDYMVPAAFVVLDAFPLTANGKTDRRSLPAPAREGGDAFVAPRSGLERTIAAAWEEVLEVERVGVEDNFFELGGHSLLLARLHRRLRDGLGRELSVVDLFRFPTVAALARHLDPDAAADGEGGEGRGRAATRQKLMRRQREPRR